MVRNVLIRHDNDSTQTLGVWLVLDGRTILLEFATLEPAWVENERNVSCIPPGRYTLRKRLSKRFGTHLHVEDVDVREWILVHRGNFRKDTRGCVLVGMRHLDLNRDGKLDVSASKDAMSRLLYALPVESTLDIVPVLP